ncbi:MAG: ankyrin repeat domain-containing protein [Candidatus Izemoplasmatales bacterium]|jgi:ankyrin repeat protein|nr:ankyrin repeat domain-containing protein [Candidatus Izemoplasmatales bacterium]
MAKSTHEQKLIDFIKKGNYDFSEPFLVPLYIVSNLKDYTFNGIEEEDIIGNYLFDSNQIDVSLEMMPQDIFDKIEKLSSEQKDYLIPRLPKFHFPLSIYLYQALLDPSHREMPVDDELTQMVKLPVLFSVLVRELFLKDRLEMTDVINDLFQDDNAHLFKAYFYDGDIQIGIQTYHQESLQHIAAKSNAPKILQFLIDEGADVDEMDYYGNTPLMFACFSGFKEVFDVLRENDADFDLENDDRIKPIESVIISENPDFMDYLIDDLGYKGTDFIHKLSVITCLEDNYTLCLKRLIEKELIDPNIPFLSGQTLFHLALELDNQEFASYLFNLKTFDPNMTFDDGYSLLFQLIKMNQKHFIKDLVKNGVDIFTTTKDGLGLLELCAKHNNYELFLYFIDCGLPYVRHLPKLIEISSLIPCKEILYFLQGEHVNMNFIIKNKITPFLNIIAKNDEELTRNFVGDIDPVFHNEHEIPLLIDPTFYNNEELTKTLLDMNIDPNIPVRTKRTEYYPILNAIHHHNLAIVQMLVEAGANVNVKYNSVLTPLSLAKQKKNKQNDIVSYLKSKGAKGISPVYMLFMLIFVGALVITYFLLHSFGVV